MSVEITAPLLIPSGVTLKGAGIGKTILTHAPAWKGTPATLPDPAGISLAMPRPLILAFAIKLDLVLGCFHSSLRS